MTKIKCGVTSIISHGILISKEISYKSFKEICSGEPKKVNLGYNNDWSILKIESNTLMPYPQSCGDFPPRKSDYNPNGYSQCEYGLHSTMSYDWEVLSKGGVQSKKKKCRKFYIRGADGGGVSKESQFSTFF